MKGYFRLLSVVLTLSLLFVSFSGFSSTGETEETLTTVRDKKMLCTATIDQDFDDSSVLVIMDNVTGGINKQHELNFFGDIGATAVRDLTSITAKPLLAQNDVSRGMEEDNSNADDFLAWFEINTETFRQILKIELNVHSKENVLKVIKKLEKIEGIQYASPNYIRNMCADRSIASDPLQDITADQWSLQNNYTNAVGAWNITTGTYKIKVGVIDSGIADHPDLNDNVVAGANFTSGSGTNDTIGHGTNVAGIIGAVGGNGKIINGICWDVSMVPLKVFVLNSDGKPKASDDAIISAISHATNNGIHILNFSGEGKQYNQSLAQAILNFPGLFVAAAGNSHSNNDTSPTYPANHSTTLTNVISVGASNELDQVWYSGTSNGSNFGANSVDLFAPGTNIVTTAPYNANAQNNKYWYDEVGGTSIAAPHVTGTAALIMSVRPDMTPAEIKKCIMDSVDISAYLVGNCVSGGRLNTYEAVRLATQPQTFTGDVNGDGRDDMIITRRQSNGKRAIDTYLGQSDGAFGSVITTTFTHAYNYQDVAFVGDVNGDCRTDLIVHTAFDGTRRIYVYDGKTDGKFTAPTICTTSNTHDYFTTKAKFFVADVNGDGKDDFIVHTKNSSGKRVNMTHLGQAAGGISYFSSSASTFTSSDEYGVDDVLIGDFNGDGKADMVVPHANSNKKRCLLVYKGQSSAPYFAVGVKFNSTKNHDSLQWPCQNFVSDINGDGKDDLAVHWKDASGKRNNLVYVGSTSGLQTEAIATIPTSNNYVAGDQVFVGDINGDGYDDMLVQWADSNNKRNLLVYKGTSVATYSAGVNYVKSETLDIIATPSCFFLSDVTNDGRADFIVKYYSGGNTAFITYIGTSAGEFGSAISSTVSTVPYFNN